MKVDAKGREEQLSPSGWWYMSFAVPNVNEGGTAAVGQGFLGGLYIDAPNVVEAISRSHTLGLNPWYRASISFVAVPSEVIDTIPERDRLRLLTKVEVEGVTGDILDLLWLPPNPT